MKNPDSFEQLIPDAEDESHPDTGQLLSVPKKQNRGKPKPASKIQPENLQPAQYVRAEVNFLRYPFFALTTRDLQKVEKIEYIEERSENGEKQRVFWRVSKNVVHGFPGPFDKRVRRAVEEILDNHPRPIPQLVRVGSTYHLCQLIGFAPSGKIKRMVKHALQRIAATTIDQDNAFYDKARRIWLPKAEGTFHLFDVFFKDQILPNGESADAIYLLLSPLYVRSLNAFYVKPLDYAYLRLLRTPLTQRLYEVYGLRFRGLRDSPYARHDYEELCQTLPITPQKRFDNAKKILEPHHRKLKATGFLAKYEWRGRQSQYPWEIFCWPGPKAKEEMKRAREVLQPQLFQNQLTDPQQRLLDWLLEVCGDHENEPAYRKIIQEYPEGVIETAIGETRQAKAERRIRRQPGAYFTDTLKRLSKMRADAR
jgi:Replication initiator protein A